MNSKTHSTKSCVSCGKSIELGAKFCSACGAKQILSGARNEASPKKSSGGSDRNRIVSGLLAIFFGGIGIHKFYLGRPVWGIIYFLFFWTFIPALVGFVEGVIYLTMKEENFQRKFG